VVGSSNLSGRAIFIKDLRNFVSLFYFRGNTPGNWDALEVVERWHLLFSGTLYSQRFSKGELLTAPEQANLNASIALWRERLMDISWFMRIINEAIARMANREDDCTGRFSSQAWLDEKS
jgi:hypothetical protein